MFSVHGGSLCPHEAVCIMFAMYLLNPQIYGFNPKLRCCSDGVKAIKRVALRYPSGIRTAASEASSWMLTGNGGAKRKITPSEAFEDC